LRRSAGRSKRTVNGDRAWTTPCCRRVTGEPCRHARRPKPDSYCALSSGGCLQSTRKVANACSPAGPNCDAERFSLTLEWIGDEAVVEICALHSSACPSTTRVHADVDTFSVTLFDQVIPMAQINRPTDTCMRAQYGNQLIHGGQSVLLDGPPCHVRLEDHATGTLKVLSVASSLSPPHSQQLCCVPRASSCPLAATSGRSR
jgi:hypothetical protein